MSSMKDTTKYLCENIKSCIIGYTQLSDIVLLVGSLYSFDYSVQKSVSMISSMATRAFNKYFMDNCKKAKDALNEVTSDDEKYFSALDNAQSLGGAVFETKVFNILTDDIGDYFIQEQMDVVENSVLALAKVHYSMKQLGGKSRNDIILMLQSDKNVDWNSLPNQYKYGIYYHHKYGDFCNTTVDGWFIDREKFNGDLMNYIEEGLYFLFKGGKTVFSSNQILEISGRTVDEEIKFALEFAMHYSGYTGSDLVYQETDDGRYCIGWKPKNSPPADGWNSFPEYTSMELIIMRISGYLGRQQVFKNRNSNDGSYAKGFLMKGIDRSLSEEKDGIINPFYGIVSFEPYICYYSK